MVPPCTLKVCCTGRFRSIALNTIRGEPRIIARFFKSGKVLLV